MTTTESKWAARVEAWRSSEKTAEEFASGQGFEPSTLRYWASRLRAAARKRPTPAVRMARVVRPEGTQDAKSVEVIVGNARIAVMRGFDAELLREVVAALGAGR
jgi:hypothetical protein